MGKENWHICDCGNDTWRMRPITGPDNVTPPKIVCTDCGNEVRV